MSLHQFFMSIALALAGVFGGYGQEGQGGPCGGQGKVCCGPCDPGKCDPGKCDPGKCDPGKCDPGKCDPGKCDPGNCDPGQCTSSGRCSPQQHQRCGSGAGGGCRR